MKKEPESEPAKVEYQPTAREQAALDKLIAQYEAEGTPRMQLLNVGDVSTVKLDHPNALFGHVLLMQALATTDSCFMDGILDQLIGAGSDGGHADQRKTNFMLSVVKGIKPMDQLETMLAAQMSATHMATMTFVKRLANVEEIPQQDSAGRILNTLMRTFATQMEALKRYRSGGEQNVTVQHVTVGEGGQAIVGNVTQAPGEAAPERTADPPKALTHSETAPMPLVDQGSKERVVVPARPKAKK